jgi:6-phosphofructokinase 1
MPYHLDAVAERVKERAKKGKRFSIIVASEGAKAKGGDVVVQRTVPESTIPIRLGGMSFVLADQIEEATGLATRPVVLGHLQRGGSPTPFDRVLASSLGAKAVDLIYNGEFGHMVGVRGSKLVKVPLTKVARGPRNVPVKEPLIAVARSVGTSFGD